MSVPTEEAVITFQRDFVELVCDIVGFRSGYKLLVTGFKLLIIECLLKIICILKYAISITLLPSMENGLY